MKNRSVATGKWPLKGQTEEVSRATAASSVKPQHWPLARSVFSAQQSQPRTPDSSKGLWDATHCGRHQAGLTQGPKVTGPPTEFQDAPQTLYYLSLGHQEGGLHRRD